MNAPADANWILLDRSTGGLESQIHRGVRDRILDGRLKPGDRLPSSRALAASLGVARSTVTAAYERLRTEGYVAGGRGAATRVAWLSAMPEESIRALPQRALTPPGESERFLPFRPGVPDLTSFPAATWARCLAARARNLRIHDLGYRDETGLPELRLAILEHVARARAVLADPEQVVIMPSAGAIVSLLARLPVGRQARPVWMEDPGYRLVRDILRDAGKSLVPIPVDGEGMTLRPAEGPAPSLLYVTPSHQYPTGVAMSLPRRLELLDFAASKGAVIIEDDYDSEFHYASRPLPALQGIDRSGCVVYVGTFSKTLAPGLRVAYAVLPPLVLEQARAVLRREGGSVPFHVQAALADFLNEGHLRAHVRRMRGLYQTRMASLRTILEDAGRGRVAPGSGAGGLQMPAWFEDSGVDDRTMARDLHARGIGAMALSAFFLDAPRPGLLFGIGSATPEHLDKLVKVLKLAWRRT